MNNGVRKLALAVGLGAVLLSGVWAGRMMPAGSFSVRERLWPLPAGSVWMYQGEVRWVDPQSGEVRSQIIQQPMRVQEVLRRGSLQAAVIEGHPQDLAWYDGRNSGQRGERYLIVEAAQGVFMVQGLRVAEVLPRLRDNKDPLTGLLRQDELIARPDMKAGESVARRRTDDASDNGAYRWFVSEDLTGAQPVAKQLPADAPGFRLTLRTLPDDTVIDFIPGVGMTRYQYRHHGTVAEADLRLVSLERH